MTARLCDSLLDTYMIDIDGRMVLEAWVLCVSDLEHFMRYQ